MKNRVKSLVLDANGIPLPENVFFDTLVRGIFGLKITADDFHPAIRKNRRIQKYFGQRYESLSYVIDWRDAICESPELDVHVCNLLNLVEVASARKNISRYPLIFVLHSAAGDNLSMLHRATGWLNHRKGKLAVFVGNEYDLLEEKIQFIKSVEADFICSQLPIETARWLYAECGRSRILPTPHALNPRVYFPDAPHLRTIDMGFVGDLYARIIGDSERTALVEYIQQHGPSLGIHYDFRFKRYSRNEWAQFLRSCKGILGAESGTYYLDRRGEGIARAKAYTSAHPQAELAEIIENCFTGLEHISGKAISSRHFEPIGTKTCQVLIEGEYNGILKADEHFISVKKDLSNVAEALSRFMNDNYRNTMVEEAYHYVLSNHTYRHRVESLLDVVL